VARSRPRRARLEHITDSECRRHQYWRLRNTSHTGFLKRGAKTSRRRERQGLIPRFQPRMKSCCSNQDMARQGLKWQQGAETNREMNDLLKPRTIARAVCLRITRTAALSSWIFRSPQRQPQVNNGDWQAPSKYLLCATRPAHAARHGAMCRDARNPRPEA